MSPPTPTPPPGRLRTWWHPSLAHLLRHLLGSGFEVSDEVPVGRVPLQLDLLLVRREGGGISPTAERAWAGLVEFLGPVTVIEFKGPTAALEPGNGLVGLAYTLLYSAQQTPVAPLPRVHLRFLAPALTAAFEADLAAGNATARPVRAGVWEILGWPTPTWLLETRVLAGPDHPLLTLFSPPVLADRRRVFHDLTERGFRDEALFLYRLIQQFRHQGEDFAMQHAEVQAMNSLEEDLFWELVASSPDKMRALIAAASPEQRLAGLPPEQRLAGLLPEQRLVGLTPEQMVASLKPEDLQRLRALLQEPPANGGPPPGP
jgi:hypothetical protein